MTNHHLILYHSTPSHHYNVLSKLKQHGLVLASALHRDGTGRLHSHTVIRFRRENPNRGRVFRTLSDNGDYKCIKVKPGKGQLTRLLQYVLRRAEEGDAEGIPQAGLQ